MVGEGSALGDVQLYLMHKNFMAGSPGRMVAQRGARADGRKLHVTPGTPLMNHLGVCACVCERERQREKESARARDICLF